MLHTLAIIIIAALVTLIFFGFFQKKTLQKNKEINESPFHTLDYGRIEIPTDANVIYKPPCPAKHPSSKYADISVNADSWAKRTIEVAINAAKAGHGPFAALILQVDKETNRIIRYWLNHNQVVVSNDPTAHAEVQVIREACADLGTFELNNITPENSKLSQPGASSYTVLYASCEPCPMCMASCYWAKIPRVIFCSTGEDAQTHANFADDEICNEIKLEYSDRKLVEVGYAPCEHNTDAFSIYQKLDSSNKYGHSTK